MSNDGAFRIIAVSLQKTTEEAMRRQSAAGPEAALLGELMVAAVLLRETIHPNMRVQAILESADHGRLVADSRSDGGNRGLVNPGNLSQDRQANFQVHYSSPHGKNHQGIVAARAGEPMQNVLMDYLQTSEQITAVVRMASSSGITGGFVLQLLPEVEHSALEQMTKRLSQFDGLTGFLGCGDLDGLVSSVFDGQEFTLLADGPLHFSCNCSHERMLMGLSSLPKEELEEMATAGEGLELRCSACGHTYQIELSSVQALVLANLPRAVTESD